MSNFIRIFVLTGLVFSFSACSTLSNCVHRNGSCFNAKINGVETIALESQTLLKQYEKTSTTPTDKADIRAIEWETSNPISGKLLVEAEPNQAGKSWFGQNFGFDYDITALTPGVVLEYRWYGASSAPGNPRVAAPLGRKLVQDALPTGDYVMRIDAAGAANWDRKYVLIRVK